MKNNELTEVKPVMPSLDGLPQEVIEYVHGLVAENVAVKKYAKIDDYDKCDNCGFESYVMPIETPATDAAIAEFKAQGIDKWIESRNGRWNGTTKEAEEFAANLRAGGKG